MPDGNRRRLLDRTVAVLLAGAALTLYVLTLAPTVLSGDAGEFQFVPYLLGVGHPTGYPLYCLLGWAWSRLLWVGDVAYRMNLFSALWAALAVGLLYRTAGVLLGQVFPDLSAMASRSLAFLAATSFAVMPTFWSQAIIAEVYSLHILLLVLIVYLLLTPTSVFQPPVAQDESRPAPPRPPGNRSGGEGLLLLTAGCLGLGLAHHRSTVLFLPGILTCLWLTKPRLLRDWRFVLKAVVIVLLPLGLYGYVPLRAPYTPYLRLPLVEGHELVLYRNTPAGFVEFALGGPFGRSVDLAVDLVARLSMAWNLVRNEMGCIGLALALFGVIWLCANRRWSLLALTGLAFALLVAFNLVYTIGDIQVLYVPVYLIMVLWAVVGAGALLQVLVSAWARVSAQDPPGLPERTCKRRMPVLLSLSVTSPLFALMLWTAGGRYADLDQSQNTGDRERWEQIMAEPLPTNAILVTNDRDDVMPMWYLQYVGDGSRVRTDLLGLYPLITPDYPTLGHILDLALGTGRPVYLLKEMPGITVKVDIEAEGSLWHVLGPAAGAEPEQPLGASLDGVMTLSGYDQIPRSPRSGDSLSVSLYWEALQLPRAEYHSFVHLLDTSGRKVAQSDHQPGGVYYPTTLWRPGERLRDDHVLVVGADVPPGDYRLLAGMYVLTNDNSLIPLGTPVVLGSVSVEARAAPRLALRARSFKAPAQ